MEPNVVTEKRMCDKCNVRSAVVWYTKRGRMNVMCFKCGKIWDIKEERPK